MSVLFPMVAVSIAVTTLTARTAAIATLATSCWMTGAHVQVRKRALYSNCHYYIAVQCYGYIQQKPLCGKVEVNTIPSSAITF